MSHCYCLSCSIDAALCRTNLNTELIYCIVINNNIVFIVLVNVDETASDYRDCPHIIIPTNLSHRHPSVSEDNGSVPPSLST